MSYIGQATTGTTKEFPESAKALNWGAFWFYWIWGPVHGYWMGLWVFLGLMVISLIPILNILSMFSIAANIYFLIKGNEIAWDIKDWPSVEAFHETQKNWAKWSTIIGVSLMILGVVAGVMLMGMFMAMMGSAAMSGN